VPPALRALRELLPSDTPALEAYIARDPIACAFLQERLRIVGHAGRSRANGRFYGIFDDDGPRGADLMSRSLSGVAYMGVNLVPHGAWDTHAGAAEWLVDCLYDERSHQPASIYGQASAVMALWSEFARRGIRSHDVRQHQPLLAMDRARFDAHTPFAPPALPLSRSSVEDLSLLMPASVAMFTEEVGFSPVEPSVRNGLPYVPDGEAYAARVRQLVEGGCSYSHVDQGTVLFKAEFSSVSAETAAIQGVWVNPQHRGRGLAAGYMRALAAAGLERSRTVSLYVNGYNYRALSAYARAGFQQVGTFATVML
jgi:GNAT superfamily N-acetyltransferase